MDMFTVIQGGIFRSVGAPVYGRQDTGWSPGGPQDRFAVQTGNSMLGNADFAPALEIVSEPVLAFEEDCMFVVIGAKCADMRLAKMSDGGARPAVVTHARVEFAEAGDRLSFGEKEYGFRVYLCYAACRGPRRAPLLARKGRDRGPFRTIADWGDPDNRIRVLMGPEYAFWRNPEILLSQAVLTTRDMSDMGMRLACLNGERPVVEMKDMISGAVSDGTIQSAPAGAIVLLRNRQTIGGYPRVLNVIEPDVDRLAQYAPDQWLRFRLVDLSEALAISRQRQSDLERFRRDWNM